MVQQAIHKAFPASTVIMVAHRILTVIDCHQILVMADGKITEAGHPHELLSKYGTGIAGKEDGHVDTMTPNTSTPTDPLPMPKNSFAAMVEQLGPTMASKLRRLAAAAWQDQQQK